MDTDIDKVFLRSDAGDDQQIRMGADVSNGDSGGSIFDTASGGGGVYVMGVIDKYWCGGYGDGGNTAEAVENAYDSFIA